MVSMVELDREEEEIQILLNDYSKDDLVKMNKSIERNRAQMFKDLEMLKSEQRLINMALGLIYQSECRE